MLRLLLWFIVGHDFFPSKPREKNLSFWVLLNGTQTRWVVAVYDEDKFRYLSLNPYTRPERDGYGPLASREEAEKLVDTLNGKGKIQLFPAQSASDCPDLELEKPIPKGT